MIRFSLTGIVFLLCSTYFKVQSNTAFNPLWKSKDLAETSRPTNVKSTEIGLHTEKIEAYDFGSFGQKNKRSEGSIIDPLDQFLKLNAEGQVEQDQSMVRDPNPQPYKGDSRKRLRTLLNQFLISQRNLDFETMNSLPSPSRLDEVYEFLNQRLSYYRYNPEIKRISELNWKIKLPSWVNLPFLGRKLKRQSFKYYEVSYTYLSTAKTQTLTAVISIDQQTNLHLEFEKSHPKARVSIIIDDMGHMSRGFNIYKTMGHPLTMSFLPFYDTSEIQSKIAYNEGFELMLHMPMQPNHKIYFRSPLVIETHLDEQEVRSRVRRSLEILPLITGFNNHQGSKATRDLNLMRIVMNEASKNRKLYFVDSVTSGSSKAHMAALEAGFASIKRNSDFLDNTKTHQAITEKLEELIQSSLNSRDIRIAIIHETKVSATAVREILPKFEALGIEIVSPGDFLKFEPL